LIILGLVVFIPSYVIAGNLQDLYNACGPANGYDKYLELDPMVDYEGRLTVDSGVMTAIKGNGAQVDLGPYGYIFAEGEDTVLDIDHVVIYGNDGAPGIYYEAASTGTVDSCTVDGCQSGVLAWIDTVVSIKNSVFTNSTEYGIAKYDSAKTTITYCDVWNNGIYDFGEFCAD